MINKRRAMFYRVLKIGARAIFIVLLAAIIYALVVLWEESPIDALVIMSIASGLIFAMFGGPLIDRFCAWLDEGSLDTYRELVKLERDAFELGEEISRLKADAERARKEREESTDERN